MKIKNGLLIYLLILLSITLLPAQTPALELPAPTEQPPSEYKYFIRTSHYSFTNWWNVGIAPNIYFYEVHLGKILDRKNKVGIKLASVRLFQPQGIQIWDLDLDSKSEWFDGRIDEHAVGGFYQRNLWKGLYASVEATANFKVFLDEDDQKIENGFRLYTSYHLGYHISLFGGRVFIEPQVHCQYWPINSEGPEGFREQVRRHDNYFLFEPNLYIGFKFN